MTKILLNTDLGSDVDDVGALALLNTFHQMKACDFIGVVQCTSNLYAPIVIDLVNHYYGHEVPVGKYRGPLFLPEDNYAEAVAKAFPQLSPNLITDESVSLLRRLLKDADDHSVTLVNIGQSNVFSQLLDSMPDQVSKASGSELIRTKVKECVIMGGYFEKATDPIVFERQQYLVEYNIQTDIPAAKHFIENAPCKITFVDFIAGYQVKTFRPLLDANNLNNPLTYAYKTYGKGPRESWDLLAVYYAVRGLDPIFTSSEVGEVKVSARGDTLFTAKEGGRHRYLKLQMTPDKVADLLDRLIMNHLPKGE